MVTLIAEEVEVSQREVEEGGDARCRRRNHPLSLVSQIANGKVETEGERDRGNACDLVCCGVTGREKIRPFLRGGLERFPEQLVINVGILERVIVSSRMPAPYKYVTAVLLFLISILSARFLIPRSQPPPAMSSITRSVAKSVLAIETKEGAGAVVRRSIGTPALRNLTPFLMLDHFRIGKGAGFPDHPHRGQATVTYMIEG